MSEVLEFNGVEYTQFDVDTYRKLSNLRCSLMRLSEHSKDERVKAKCQRALDSLFALSIKDFVEEVNFPYNM